MTIWKEFPVEKRLDDSFVIQTNGYPYNVCPRKTDPDGIHDYEEVSEFWEQLTLDDPRRQMEELPALPSLTETVAARNAEVAALRGDKLKAGIVFNGQRFDADDTAQARINGVLVPMTLAAQSGATPSAVQWITMDNQTVELEMADLVMLGQMVSAHISACVLTARRHCDALAVLTDGVAVAAYDITEGWPV